MSKDRISISDSSKKIKEEIGEICEWAFNTYSGEVDQRFLLQLASRLEPSTQSYRSFKVRMQGLNVVVPGPHKVYEQLEEVLDEVNNEKLTLLESAILAHFHIIRIQPFPDGNKRTARMLQNTILRTNQYPPIKIERAEKDFYLDLFVRAADSYYARRSEPTVPTGLIYDISGDEARFFEYLASKALISLGHMQAELATKRCYSVDLRTKEKGMVYTARRSISSVFRKRGIPGRVKLQGRDRLRIVGDIGEETIKAVLDGMAYLRYYDLKVIRD